MTTAIVTEDSGWWLLARCNIDAVVADFTQANVSTVTWKAFSVSDSTTATNTGTETVSSVVFDTLQTTPAKPDATGYNLRIKFLATEFTSPGRYRLEVLVTPVSAQPFWIVDSDGAPPVITVNEMWTS